MKLLVSRNFLFSASLSSLSGLRLVGRIIKRSGFFLLCFVRGFDHRKQTDYHSKAHLPHICDAVLNGEYHGVASL